jgi:UDP-N-acetylmuramoyl-L-alanyl-D-glutamate--2,6-diaminopimelate ligase
MKLIDLLRRLDDARVPAAARALDVHGVRSAAAEVVPGDIFVAVPGEAADGREFAADAVARGAVAVVAESKLDVAVPVIVVSDARRALAALAAAALGDPADRLRLVGITGTVGKTSVLLMLGAILDEAGTAAGTIGSLGIRSPGVADETPNTTPGAQQLQQALADMAANGARVAAMEVTSHALVQDRVHGLRFDLGIFTNLTMLEHLEYHGSFRAYAEAKRQFLSYLEPAAPLIYPTGDRVVSTLVRGHPGPRISCGVGGAVVTLRRDAQTVWGTRATLCVRRPLPRVGAPPLAPCAVPLDLGTLGRTHLTNATFAATAGLCLGAAPDAVQTALAGLQPPRRRLEVIRRGDPVIIDDTVGHPDSITGVFEVAERIPHRLLHVVFCIRGRRGPVINERDAEALAIWSRRVPIATLHVTSAADTADDRNDVVPAERTAFLRVLDAAGLPYTHHDRLADAVAAAIATSGQRDLLLLLGAQGMDAGAELARAALAAQGRSRKA